MSKTLTANTPLWKSYRKNDFKFDFIAAIVVFLVAIPLCLGIALASGAPLFSGILSGIIGGIVVGLLSGSQVSVSGPAAGMAAVVVTTITQLGNFEVFLLALFLAGIIQIITGFLKAGFIADYVPSNVVQGLLCAIGILLITKQLPFTFTISSDLMGLEHQLKETTEGLELSPFYETLSHINNGAIIISLIAFSILIFFEKTKITFLKNFPAPIVVVVASILINELFLLYDSSLAQSNFHLVNIPEQNLFTQIQTPNWAAWKNPKVYLYAFIIAIVASLVSLLNEKAGEKLDKQKRYCSKDRELVAQGIGNMLAGLIGGIPISSVIVRTSVNIEAGGKTKLAAILHGIFLLFAVMLIPGLLNKIPLSSLAVILIFTGYKLTTPAIYKSIYNQGLDRFIPFIVTVVSIVATDLLKGIIIGLFVSLFFILRSNSQARLDIIKEIHPSITTNRLILPQQISFLNKASLVAELNSLPSNSQLIIDARYSDYIDKEIIEFLHEFKEEQGEQKQIAISLIGFKDHYDIHKIVDFINVTTYNYNPMLKPNEVLTLLQEGNQRFLHDARIHRSSKLDIRATSTTQHPMAIVLGCIDSRVPVETIFDMSFGDLFCIRVAGNVVNNDVLASMEYGCRVVGAKLIVVLGHTRCGAIQSACDDVKLGHITELLAKIKPAVKAETHFQEDRNGKNDAFVAKVTALNIANTLQEVYQQSAILRAMIDKEEIGMIGATYDVSSGQVHFGNYLSLTEENPLEQKIAELMDKANLGLPNSN